MENAFDCGEVSGGGGNRVGYSDTVTSACTSDPSHDRVPLPLLGGDLVVVGSFFGGFIARG